ncbi:MAG: hypothetical protein MRECE_21c009 [Mycoplasmataceae bacterium CE_OT135]|nr:MAG: hypothetical protein MRECE_21c009 [Mycoplasmataceae bacterium CE_OT135]
MLTTRIKNHFNTQLKATSESKDCEIIDQEILELEKEKTEWQKSLVELESKRK